MTDKPKPLTKAEWDDFREYLQCEAPYAEPEVLARIAATLDVLFRYRERTRGMFDPGRRNGDADDTDQIASEEGIE
jgi:hypothetical protein